MSSILGTLAVKLTATTTEFVKAMDSAVDTLEKVQKEAGATSLKFGAAFAAMGAAAFYALKQVDETRQAQLKLQAAIGNRKGFDTSALEAYAGEMQNLTTFSDDAALHASAVLARYAKSSEQITTLIPHVADLAAVMGSDLPDAAMQVGRAMAMGSGALTRMGIAMKDSQKAAFDAAGPQQRLAMIAELLERNFGGAAEAMKNTFGGSLKFAKNQFDNLTETIGKLFEKDAIGFFRLLGDSISKLTGWFSELSPQMLTVVKWLGYFSAGAVGAVAGLSAIAFFIPQMIEGFSAMSKVLQGLQTAMARTFLPAVGWIAAIAAAVGLIIVIVGALKIAWDKNWMGMQDTVKSFVTTITDWWEKTINFLTQKWEDFHKWFSRKAILAMTFITGGSREDAEKTIKEMDSSGQGIFSTGEGSGARDFAKGVANTAGDALDGLTTAFKAGTDVFGDLLKPLFKLIPAFEATADATIKTGKAMAEGADDIRKMPVTIAQLMNMAREQGKLRDSTEATQRGFAGGVFLGTDNAQRNFAEQDKLLLAASKRWDTGQAMALDAVTSSFGEAGGAIKNVVQGFVQGGPIGGIATAFITLFQRTESFKKISAMASKIMDTLASVLEPLGEAIIPLVDAFGGIAKMLAQVLIPAMKIMAPVIKIWGTVQKTLALIIAYVIKGVAGLWNGIIGAIAGIFKKIGSLSILGAHPLAFLKRFGESIEGAKVNVDGLNKVIKDMKNDSALADDTFAEGAKSVVQHMADNLKALGITIPQQLQKMFDDEAAIREKAAIEAAKQARKQALLNNMLDDTVENLNKELTNMPQGFKDTLYRFNATVAGLSGGPGVTAVRDIAAPGTVQNTNVYIYANDAPSVARAVTTELQRNNIAISGSPVSNGQPFSTGGNTRVRRFG